MGNCHTIARRRSKGHFGEGLVEFAIVLPLFFLLIFAILDLGHMYFVQVTLENAVRQAGRFAVTGRSLTPLTRVESIRTIAKNAALGMDLKEIIISSSSGSATGDVGSAISNPNAAGGPGDNVNITLTTHLGFFTHYIGQYYGPNQTNTFSVSTTFRNEQFPYNLIQ